MVKLPVADFKMEIKHFHIAQSLMENKKKLKNKTLNSFLIAGK